MRARCDAIADAMGTRIAWRETAEPLPDALSFLGAMANDLVVGSARIRERLGFREITTEDERLADLIAWLRETVVSPPS
jgi:hypothetical protein